jgi:hypothetical protein
MIDAATAVNSRKKSGTVARAAIFHLQRDAG